MKNETSLMQEKELRAKSGMGALILTILLYLVGLGGVIAGGILPRKTFSMGHAREKRYYLEGRKIK